jgi:hypothetical protein
MFSGATFEELIPKLRAAIEWFNASGVRISPTRLGHYGRLLAEILELQQTLDQRQAAEKYPDYVNALFCAHDIAAIYAAFKGSADNALCNAGSTGEIGNSLVRSHASG